MGDTFKLRFTKENGTPELWVKLESGEVVICFSENEKKEENVKNSVLRMVLQSYEDRVLDNHTYTQQHVISQIETI